MEIHCIPWYTEFNNSRGSLSDEFPKGRPKSVVVQENVVRAVIMQDRNIVSLQHSWIFVGPAYIQYCMNIWAPGGFLRVGFCII